MKKVVHRAESRGGSDHGWLKSYHSFSFAGYQSRDRMGFGLLRVLNDDTVAPGAGFGTHPHDNMEIISIPLKGALRHSDNMGNTAVIRKGDVQVMSAGSGIAHSEYNHSETEAAKFLQIWIFPDKKNVTPRYGQTSYPETGRRNKLQEIVYPGNGGDGTWMHQQAWMHLANTDTGTPLSYKWKKAGNGLYVFVLEGKVTVEGETLSDRDAIGLTEASETEIGSVSGAEFLLIEVPMR